MKAALTFLILAASVAVAREPATPRKAKTRSPAKLPSIIVMPTPVPGAKVAGNFVSELAGVDLQFLQQASLSAREQGALAELAKRQEASEQVTIVADSFASTQATELRELERLAQARTASLSSAAPDLDALVALKGPKFEKEWIERLIGINERSVAAYEGGAKSKDAELRGFAEKMLPIAKARLQVASRLGGRATPSRPVTDASQPAPIEPPIAPSAGAPSKP